MARSAFDFPRRVEDSKVRGRALSHLRERGVRLPTFAELGKPDLVGKETMAALAAVDADDADPLNLYRVHWFNDDRRRGRQATPAHVELPEALTGVRARIVVALGALFPMIRAHKVLAAYASLVPRLISGRFDPLSQRAVWPSTGNYCRGGVAISRILGCRAAAVLPAGMSEERFLWLREWVDQPEDIVRTPGSEANVKEVFQACDELARDPANEIVDQFSEFGNYLGHWRCTGPALEKIFLSLCSASKAARLAGFVAGSGSSGTLAAGDYLKEGHGARIAVIEAVECPTLLKNGFGEHNIQGIGDKHVPYIHNVMNTDLVVGVSDQATDTLFVLFNTEEGRNYLIERRGIDAAVAAQLGNFGLSGLCNILAAIKTARYLDLGPDDVVLTVATDGAELYASEIGKVKSRRFGDRFDAVSAGETWGRSLAAGIDHVLELSHLDRKRIFNLGYFTWVEQQGVPLEEFAARAQQSFWDKLLDLAPAWDAMIDAFNAKTGVAATLKS